MENYMSETEFNPNVGTIIFVIGPSISGKNKVKDYLTEGKSQCAQHANYNFSTLVSTTTRDKRPKEIEGKDYYFVKDEQFDKMEKDGKFLRIVETQGNRYGITIDEIENKISKLKSSNKEHLVIDISSKTMNDYKKMFSKMGVNVVTVFMDVSAANFIQRLKDHPERDNPEKRKAEYFEVQGRKSKCDLQILTDNTGNTPEAKKRSMAQAN